MKIGDYVFKGNGSAIYGPTFGRGGLGAVFTATALQIVGSPTLVITVDHKNHEDTTWASAGAFGNITAVGQSQTDLSSLKEEIRFVYAITATNAWEGVLLLMTAPAWRPYA